MTARDMIKALECCDLDKQVVILVMVELDKEAKPVLFLSEVRNINEDELGVIIQ